MGLTVHVPVEDLYNPQRQKTYRRVCASFEDSDQPAHFRRLIRIYTGRILIAKSTNFLHAENEDSDKTAWMGRVI